MKTLFRLLFIAIMLIYASRSFAQETFNKGDATIHIQILGPDLDQKTLIDIYKRDNYAKIEYARFDSTKRSALRKDTAFLKISKPPYNFTTEQQVKLNKIYEAYSVYDKNTTTINLNQDTTYRNILALMINTSRDNLANSKIGKVAILDGVYFGCTIITDTEKKKVYIHQPTPKTHPIVSAFLKESIERVIPVNKPKSISK
jgi:hypothetical protein